MTLKNIRVQRNWSQDDLAQASGLSVRTVQRVERTNKAGLESLKSLAAAFDIDVAELRDALNATSDDNDDKNVRAKTIIQFFSISGALVLLMVFPLMSALKDSSNWGAFAVMFFSLALILGVFAWQTFGSSWEKKIIEKL